MNNASNEPTPAQKNQSPMIGEHSPAESRHSVWLDTIDRAIIESGQLERLIQAGVSGVTSQPIAAAKVIRYRDDYNRLLSELDREGKTREQLVEVIVLYDIQTAADYLHPIFDQTEHMDGYASFDINPALAPNTKGLVSEGLRLADMVDRVNTMVQVPATPDGIRAMEALIGEGVNVNATLIFSPHTYEAVVEAYIAGLETFVDALDIWPTTPASVASVPIAWLDQAVDEHLGEIDSAEARDLIGQIGTAVARVIDERYRTIFGDERWQKLAEDTAHPARVQRPLWAESAAPCYAGTINSLPPVAAEKLLARGEPAEVSPSLAEAQEQLATLARLGVDLANVEQRLQQQRLAELRNAYRYLASDVADKRDLLQSSA